MTSDRNQSARHPVLSSLPPQRAKKGKIVTAEEAVRTCKLARELLGGHDLVKLEVLGDEKTLFPDVIQTLKAAEELVKDNFKVMVYTSDDLLIAKELEDIGCVAVMPLAAPIGSGLGIRNPYNIRFIVVVLIDSCLVCLLMRKNLKPFQ